MYDVKRSARGATRNNLIFNDVCIFRVVKTLTLKMPKPLLLSGLQVAHAVKWFQENMLPGW